MCVDYFTEDDIHTDKIKYTIIVGDVIDGFKCYGVFSTQDDAVNWANHTDIVDDFWCAIPIKEIK